MPNQAEPVLSDEQKRLLQHEAFISEVLKQRASSTRVSLLDRPVAVAIAAGLIGFFGAFVPLLYQSRATVLEKEREYREAREHELRVKRVETVVAALTAVGRLRTAVDDLLDVARGRLKLASKAEREAYRTTHNAADDTWRQEQDKISLSLGLYYGIHSPVVAAEDRVREAVETYASCLEGCWHDASCGDRESVSGCAARRTSLGDALDVLRSSVAKALADTH
jgi:hypothetical protein